MEAGGTADVVLVPAPASDGATVFGRILDSEGQPLRTAVNLNGKLLPRGPPSGRGCQSDSGGEFRVTGVSVGPKLAILWSLGYLRQFEVPAGAKAVDLGTFKVRNQTDGAVVQGHVVDEQEIPLRSAMVCLAADVGGRSWCRFAETDGGGDYRFDSVPPGRYLIWHEPTFQTNYVIRKAPVPLRIDECDTRCDLRLARR